MDNQGTLCVSGVGKSHIAPDRFSVRISVGLEHPDDEFVFKKVASIADGLLKVLKDWAKEGDSIRSTSFSNYHYEYKEKIGKWSKGQMITVVSTDFLVDSPRVDDVSSLISLAKKSGATSVSSVEFRLSDDLRRIERGIALRRAVDAARFDAEVTADELGVPILGPQRVTVSSERHYSTYDRMGLACNSACEDDDKDTEFIEAGEIATSVSIDVVYTIGGKE